MADRTTGVNTLVLVHRQQLLDNGSSGYRRSWVAAKAIGRLGGGRKKPTGIMDVALIQSLVRKGVVNDSLAATAI